MILGAPVRFREFNEIRELALSISSFDRRSNRTFPARDCLGIIAALGVPSGQAAEGEALESPVQARLRDPYTFLQQRNAIVRPSFELQRA